MSKEKQKYGSNIPKARDELEKVAQSLEANGDGMHAGQIREIINQFMFKEFGMRRAPSTRTKVTDDIRKAVEVDLRTTDLTQEAIAAKYNIDGGRVSEIYRLMRN